MKNYVPYTFFEEYTEPEDSIPDVIKYLNTLGFSVVFENPHGRSKYASFYSERGSCMFIIRFSDHSLCHGNYIPAGVINDRWGEDLETFSIEKFERYYEEYKSMSDDDVKDLWENRYVEN